MTCDNPLVPFGSLAALSGLLMAVAVWKRYTYVVLIAAIVSGISEFAWATHCVGPTGLTEARVMFLLTQALFLGFCLAAAQANIGDSYTIAAGVIAGAAPLLSLVRNWNVIDCSRDSGIATILLSAAGLIALAVVARRAETESVWPTVIVGIALALTWKAEWSWYADSFGFDGFDDRGLACTTEIDPDYFRNTVVVLLYAIFFLFARTPYLCGTKRRSLWIMSALAGPPQLWLIHTVVELDFYPEWFWLLPIAFALPAVTGMWHLVRNERVRFTPIDPRLVSQALAAVLFLSLAFPMQLASDRRKATMDEAMRSYLRSAEPTD